MPLPPPTGRSDKAIIAYLHHLDGLVDGLVGDIVGNLNDGALGGDAEPIILILQEFGGDGLSILLLGILIFTFVDVDGKGSRPARIDDVGVTSGAGRACINDSTGCSGCDGFGDGIIFSPGVLSTGSRGESRTSVGNDPVPIDVRYLC
eukprot:CAMPEP_0178656710 /NCGR_PEP_ID=MMETSP0698-20121128/24965_1 /TAXON_ID=265572 /ORGANISM="Extubocellulus spinifer, Strain CCMP396" /LENGTH=147 /DNA_ID=CAMNT_0020298775 /DNA_START=256 /DNA_END=700 /DNA_ORIENTATION=-